MDEKIIIQIIKEFYGTIAPLLAYQEDGLTRTAEEALLDLLCQIRDRQDLKRPCWDRIREATWLQVCTDASLLETVETVSGGVAVEEKLKMLTQQQVYRRQHFSRTVFLCDLEERADAGGIAECKLLAALNWLGWGVERNESAALRIWSILAVNGDIEAMGALVYGYRQREEQTQAGKWEHVMGILNRERENFSSVARKTHYPQCTTEELELANAILYIVHNKQTGKQKINRSMLQYVLDSREDYRLKMKRLATESVYQLVLYDEDKFTGRKFGF